MIGNGIKMCPFSRIEIIVALLFVFVVKQMQFVENWIS